MGFIEFCVGFVIILLIMIVTGLTGWITSMNDADSIGFSWIVSSIGFGICLTVLLYQNGIIK